MKKYRYPEYGKCPVCGFATIYLNAKGEPVSKPGMDTYKAAAEKTDEAERLLTPAFRKTNKWAELEKKHAKEVADLERSERMREHLPDLIRDTASFCHHPDHTSVIGWRSYNFKNPPRFADAVKVVEAMKDRIVEAEHWKGACVSCRPAEVNSEARKAQSVMDGAHAVEIVVSGGRGYQSIEVRFWAIVADWLVEVHLPVADLLQLIPNVKATYNRYGEVCTCEITWPEESRCVDSFRKWWSEKPSYRGSYYLADFDNFKSWAGKINAVRERL